MTRTSGWIRTWSVVRAAVAIAIVAAIVAQLAASTTTAIELGRDVGLIWANFFSFFTILSNTLAAIVLAWAVVWFWTRGRGGAAEPRTLTVALVCVSTYMIITAIVYNALLRGITLPQGSEPIAWSNEVLHLIAPIVLLLDVLIGAPRRAVRWRAVWVVVAFPIVWVVYTMIRGPLVSTPSTGEPFWYPYPFLNPANFAAGYGGVAVYVVAIAAAIIAVGFGVVWVGRRRTRARTTPAG